MKAISASDTVPVVYDSTVAGCSIKPRGIYVGGTGNLTVKDDNGNSTLIEAIPVGTLLPIAPVYVMATGTSATKLVALF